jgi:hypothetical protein
MDRLYSCDYSDFTGKTRAALRYKQRMGALGPGFDDVLATPELIAGRLLPPNRRAPGALPDRETRRAALFSPPHERIPDGCVRIRRRKYVTRESNR